MTTRDDKYVVLKASDVRWRDHPAKDDKVWPRTATISDDKVVPDATVIRGQDAFAAPALWAYANTIGLFAQELRNVLTQVDPANYVAALRDRSKQLQAIADHFSEAAEDSAHSSKRLPD